MSAKTFLFLLLGLMGVLLGWCYSEAYITGPGRHYRKGWDAGYSYAVALYQTKEAK